MGCHRGGDRRKEEKEKGQGSLEISPLPTVEQDAPRREPWVWSEKGAE